MNHSDKLSVFIISYDAAEELWYGLDNCLKEYWEDCPFDIYVLTQKKKIKGTVFNIINIDSEDHEATYRINESLKLIDSPYVLLMCDDYFINRKVSSKGLLKICKYMETRNIVCVHLEPYKKWKVSDYRGRFPVSGGIPSIYKKDMLYDLTLHFNKTSMRKMETNAYYWVNKNGIRVVNIRSPYFTTIHCVLEGYWRLFPYLYVKKKLWNVQYMTYKKPNPRHSIYAVTKFVLYNIVLRFFPGMYNIYASNKYKIKSANKKSSRNL